MRRSAISRLQRLGMCISKSHWAGRATLSTMRFRRDPHAECDIDGWRPNERGTAGRDECPSVVKATVSQVPALDSRWLLLGPGKKQTLDEATKRARGEIGYPPPGARVIGNLRGAPIRERLVQYAPVEDADKAPNCAMLFILAEKEELFDNRDHGVKAHERAKGPKKLVVIPNITHYGVYQEAREQAQKEAVDWYDAHLKGDAAHTTPP